MTAAIAPEPSPWQGWSQLALQLTDAPASTDAPAEWRRKTRVQLVEARADSHRRRRRPARSK